MLSESYSALHTTNWFHHLINQLLSIQEIQQVNNNNLGIVEMLRRSDFISRQV